MSVQELQHSVAELTAEERFDLAVFLQHLAQKDDSEHQRALDQADARISSGKKVSLEELRKMVSVMNEKGL
jgi:hypothetical protein